MAKSSQFTAPSKIKNYPEESVANWVKHIIEVKKNLTMSNSNK